MHRIEVRGLIFDLKLLLTMADTVNVPTSEPGFYLKFSVCNEHGEELVQGRPTRILTAREFYEQRLIPANIAHIYVFFARFAGKASEGVNLLDALTAFSRSNCPPRPAKPSEYALEQIATQAIDTLAAVVNVLRESEDSNFIEALETAMAWEGKKDGP